MNNRKQQKKQDKTTSSGYRIPGLYLTLTVMLTFFAIFMKLLDKIGLSPVSSSFFKNKPKAIKTSLSSKNQQIKDKPAEKPNTPLKKASKAKSKKEPQKKASSPPKKSSAASKRVAKKPARAKQVKKESKGKAEAVEILPVAAATEVVADKGPPLLTFSVTPPMWHPLMSDDEVEKKHVKVPAPVQKQKQVAQKVEDEEASAWHRKLHHSLNILCDIVPKLMKQLTDQPSNKMLKDNLGRLAANLAFLYRFHQLNLAFKQLSKPGDDKETLYDLRTNLVHSIGKHMLDNELLNNTREQLGTISLDELDHIDAFNLDINTMNITNDIKDLSLYSVINANKDIDKGFKSNKDFEAWVQKQAIPLLNSLHREAMKSGYHEKSQYFDAIRMFVIVIGDYCKPVKEKRTDVTPFQSFLQDCRLKRNAFAHVATPYKANRTLTSLLKQANGVNNSTISDSSVNDVIYSNTKRTVQSKKR